MITTLQPITDWRFELHAEELAGSGNTKWNFPWETIKSLLLVGQASIFIFIVAIWLTCFFPQNLSNILCSLEFTQEYSGITAIITYGISDFQPCSFYEPKFTQVLNGMEGMHYDFYYRFHRFFRRLTSLNLGSILQFMHLSIVLLLNWQHFF